MAKVVCLSPMPKGLLEALLSDVVDEIIVFYDFVEEEIIRELENADVVIGDYTFKIPIGRKMLEAMKNVKLVQQPSTGYDHIDISSAKELGIRVANVGSVNALSVAEHTIMLALALLKKLIYANKRTFDGFWAQGEMFDLGFYELFGKTWGILGMGRQGREVIRRLQGWGVNVIYNDLRKDEEIEKNYNARFVDFETLLKESDILSIHLPLTDKTRKMIGEKELRMMKNSAFLINVARGEIVDEGALLKALKENWIAGAALDVFENEPTVSEELRKLRDKNLILTPHIAGATNEARVRIIREAIENIRRALRGEEVKNVVS
ncbi:MAG: 2-hydroxyacid dehydrogenase [Archaeoglobaceae archaeon]